MSPLGSLRARLLLNKVSVTRPEHAHRLNLVGGWVALKGHPLEIARAQVRAWMGYHIETHHERVMICQGEAPSRVSFEACSWASSYQGLTVGLGVTQPLEHDGHGHVGIRYRQVLVPLPLQRLHRHWHRNRWFVSAQPQACRISYATNRSGAHPHVGTDEGLHIGRVRGRWLKPHQHLGGGGGRKVSTSDH
jgi:hypothetical protein